MAFFYFDDSKHHQFGLTMGAFVICDDDPAETMEDIFREFGFNPKEYEFKSRTPMAGNEKLQQLRSALTWHVAHKCKIAVCLVGEDDRRLGPASLRLLQNALRHPALADTRHEVYFDEGLFSSREATQSLGSSASLPGCNLHFEQDSHSVMGIQLADIVARTASLMLLETLGHITKKVIVDAPEDEAYHGLEIELGFELWAGIRYAFLSQNKPEPDEVMGYALVDVFPWGLFIDEEVNDDIQEAAMKRFGENYLGCIH